MKQIRFIQLGDADALFIYNLANQLNAIQDYFFFDIDPNQVQLDLKSDNGIYNEDQIDTYGASIIRKNYPGEYPISICNVPLRNDLSFSFDNDSAVVSLHNWGVDLSNISKDKLLAFHLVDILLSRRINLPAHNNVRGCPSDHCDHPNDRIVGFNQCEFCSECHSIIRHGIELGTISLKEAVSTFRILDWIAERNRVFVIMPCEMHIIIRIVW